MKYWLLVLLSISSFSYAEETEDCHITPGGLAYVESCVQSLAIDEQENYEKAYTAFLNSEYRRPEQLNNPEEFLGLVEVAKKTWEATTEFDCKAEGLLNIKDTFAERTEYNACLYRAYKQRITHYKDLETR